MSWKCTQCQHEGNQSAICSACGHSFTYKISLQCTTGKIEITEPEVFLGRKELNIFPGKAILSSKTIRIYYSEDGWRLANISSDGQVIVDGLKLRKGNSCAIRKDSQILIGEINLTVK